MDFEFIDEDQIESSRSEKQKKTPSLFDSPLIERHYWGNDAGTELAMSLTRIQIGRCIRKMKLLDIDNYDFSRRLNKEYREELCKYQLKMLCIMLEDKQFTIIQNNDGDMEIVLI